LSNDQWQDDFYFYFFVSFLLFHFYLQSTCILWLLGNFKLLKNVRPKYYNCNNDQTQEGKVPWNNIALQSFHLNEENV
jgi:hypothetical protein